MKTNGRDSLFKLSKLIRSEQGMATVETVPLLLIFVVLMSYTLGAFGIIHTGILQSIAARNYAFETFRNRSSLEYFRDTTTRLISFRPYGTRLHAIVSDRVGTQNDTFFPTERPIRIGIEINQVVGRTREIHINRVPADIARGKRNETVETNPVWVINQYGMCLDPRCGD